MNNCWRKVMTSTGFCFALTETSTMLQQPSELYRNALDLNRHALDLNKHVLDLNEIGVHSPEASALLEARVLAEPNSDYKHAGATDFWPQQAGDVWGQGLPNWPELFRKFSEQEQDIRSGEDNLGRDQSDGPGVCYDATPKSQDPTIKFIIDSPTWLPDGWITEVQTRRTGTTAGTRDKYYKDPVSGRRFRSRNEVLHFLQTGRGRVRRRYKPRFILTENAAAACVMTQFLNAFTGRPSVDAGGQPMPMPSPLCPRSFQPDSVAKATSLESTYMAFSLPPVTDQLPDERSSRVSKCTSSASQNLADRKGPKSPGVSRKAAKVVRKRKPQDRSQKLPQMKKVRFETEKENGDRQDGTIQKETGDRQDSKLWQRHQEPVGLCEETKKDQPCVEPLRSFVGHGFCEMPRAKEQKVQNSFGSSLQLPSQQAWDKPLYPRHVAPGNTSQILLPVLERPPHSKHSSVVEEEPRLTSRQRARKVQKMKNRQAKEMLALLGRKLCWQRLGLPL